MNGRWGTSKNWKETFPAKNYNTQFHRYHRTNTNHNGCRRRPHMTTTFQRSPVRWNCTHICLFPSAFHWCKRRIFPMAGSRSVTTYAAAMVWHGICRQPPINDNNIGVEGGSREMTTRMFSQGMLQNLQIMSRGIYGWCLEARGKSKVTVGYCLLYGTIPVSRHTTWTRVVVDLQASRYGIRSHSLAYESERMYMALQVADTREFSSAFAK